MNTTDKIMALADAAAICRTYDCSPRMAAAEIEALKGKL